MVEVVQDYEQISKERAKSEREKGAIRGENGMDCEGLYQ